MTITNVLPITCSTFFECLVAHVYVAHHHGQETQCHCYIGSTYWTNSLSVDHLAPSAPAPQSRPFAHVHRKRKNYSTLASTQSMTQIGLVLFSACHHGGSGVSALVGPASKSGSGVALVDEWQLCVLPDAVTHVHANTDAWGRGSRAFHPTRFRVRARRARLRLGF